MNCFFNLVKYFNLYRSSPGVCSYNPTFVHTTHVMIPVFEKNKSRKKTEHFLKKKGRSFSTGYFHDSSGRERYPKTYGGYVKKRDGIPRLSGFFLFVHGTYKKWGLCVKLIPHDAGIGFV